MPRRLATRPPRLHATRPVLALCAVAIAVGALLSVNSAPAALAPGDLPPDLVADSVNDIVLSTDAGAGGDRLLLRFAGYIHNAGQGALEIWGVRATTNAPIYVTQRFFGAGGGYRDDPSPAQLIYETADGHDHWHLMHAARYSLWNSARSAEAAPAMKVGFCLEDSEHVDPFGPGFAVYGGSRNHHFCEQGHPNTLNVFHGISPGWRDEYHNELAFQWVDVSSVQPGSYWLRSDVDPDGVIVESGEANQPAWAGSQTTIPGYVAQSLDVDVSPGVAATVTRQVQRFGSPGAARYRIESGPAHGSLDAAAGTWQQSPAVVYTPAPGFQGVDTFTYSARDNASQFPLSPALATVTLHVGAPPAPTVQISGAPEAMVAGTSVQLQATVTNDAPGVTWTVDGATGGEPSHGTISSEGVFTAPASPPGGGAVTIAAHSAAGGHDERRVRIDAQKPPQPAPLPPSAAPQPSNARLTKPEVIRIGRTLVLTTVPARAGVVRLSAYAHRRLLGACSARTPAGRRFTCRLRLSRRHKATAPVSVVASLRVKGRLIAVRRRAAAPAPSHVEHHDGGL